MGSARNMYTYDQVPQRCAKFKINFHISQPKHVLGHWDGSFEFPKNIYLNWGVNIHSFKLKNFAYLDLLKCTCISNVVLII